jgi:hypothetical protein
LDPRFLANAPKSAPAPVSRLPADRIAAGAGPLHFIFHTAFCCSTLLTRALDVPGVSMGLKEPAVIVSFARHWMHPRHRAGVPAALDTTLDLLARPMGRGETQIVKPTNAANYIAPYLLNARGRTSKAILLFSNLEVYLKAIARRGESGAAMARTFLAGFLATIPFDNVTPPLDPAQLTDLQAAAAAWLMNMTYFEEIMRRLGPARVRALNGDSLVTDPARTLGAAAAFLDLPDPPGGWESVAAGHVFQEHAKTPQKRFDADLYHAQIADFPRRADLAAAYDWTRKLSTRCNAPMSLPETLFT